MSTYLSSSSNDETPLNREANGQGSKHRKRLLQQNAIQKQSLKKRADYLTSLPQNRFNFRSRPIALTGDTKEITVAEAKSKYEEVFTIHQQGAFQMCRWRSNSKELINYILPDLTTLGKTDCSIETEIPERIVSMAWNPNVDTLTYDLSFYKVRPEILSQAEVPIKRVVCKVAMAIFNPLGLVIHLTIPGN
ncbi:unnamed protein product, partial [Allacma fusca]